MDGRESARSQFLANFRLANSRDQKFYSRLIGQCLRMLFIWPTSFLSKYCRISTQQIISSYRAHSESRTSRRVQWLKSWGAFS